LGAVAAKLATRKKIPPNFPIPISSKGEKTGIVLDQIGGGGRCRLEKEEEGEDNSRRVNCRAV